jgi:hypothetical protein
MHLTGHVFETPVLVDRGRLVHSYHASLGQTYFQTDNVESRQTLDTLQIKKPCLTKIVTIAS